MFNIFKKKKNRNIKEWEFLLLQKIAEKLPLKYAFLKRQIHPDFFLDSTDNVLLGDNWKRVICNQNLYRFYKNNDINYVIENILVYNLDSTTYINVDIDVYNGIIIGYRIHSNSERFDVNLIDIDKIREKQFINKDLAELKIILGDIPLNIASLLNIDDTFKIEIPEGCFYVIKDLGNGDYLSMDTQGNVFGMIHDPYEIEKLFDSKESFYDALNSGEFNILEYYDKKMS